MDGNSSNYKDESGDHDSKPLLTSNDSRTDENVVRLFY